MSADIENVLRVDLFRQAETIVASDDLKREIVARMAPERAAYARVQRRRLLGAAAAVVALAVGVAALWSGRGSEQSQPAPPVPSVSSNSDVLKKMPIGAAPRVLIRNAASRVTSPDGRKFSIDLERRLLGRSGERVLTFDYAGYSVVDAGGSSEKLSGPNPALYAVSADGTTFYRNGTLLDIATMRETGALAVPDNLEGQCTADWTAAGIVFSTDTNVVLVPVQGTPVSVPALASATSVQFAVGSNRVLVTPGSGCPYVAELKPNGQLKTVHERCERDLISLSRDGSTGLLGERNSAAAPPGIGTVTGLLNVDTGAVTQLPWLAGFDEFPSDDSCGDDLFSYTWENGNAVLLAYYVARDVAGSRNGTVRVVRCTRASDMCEVTPGTVNPLLYTATIFSQGIGE